MELDWELERVQLGGGQLHREAWQELVNFFTYIKESISYNTVYLACAKNFAVTVTLIILCSPIE